MAKYRLRNGKDSVKCEILNESVGKYIVRFKNGKIKSVPKSSVRDLDRIDEGVVDAVRSGADAVKKFGRHVAGALKSAKTAAVKGVKELFATFVKLGNMLLFKTKNGEFITANHPVNIIDAAKKLKHVSFVPSSETQEMCDIADIDCQSVVDDNLFKCKYSGPYLGVQKTANESVFSKRGKKINEDVDPKNRLLVGAYDEQGQLMDIFDNTMEQIKRRIKARFTKLIDDEDSGTLLLIYGAPGIGKSEILSNISKELDCNLCIVNCNGLTSDGLGFDSIKKITYKNDKGEVLTKEAATFIARCGLPVYDVVEAEANGTEELADAIANGGVVENGVIKDSGKGGVLFLDEFTRVHKSAQQLIFDFPYSRRLHQNKLGSKWLVVCAANRPNDLNESELEDLITFGTAGNGRFTVVNYVPSVSAWVEWAEATDKKGNQNVHQQIIEFIKSTVNESDISQRKASDLSRKDRVNYEDSVYGMLYYTNKNKNYEAMACPRKWAALSKDLRAICKSFSEFEDINYFDADGILKMCKINADSVYAEACGDVGKYPGKMFVDYILRYATFTDDFCTRVLNGNFTKTDIDDIQSLFTSSSNVGNMAKDKELKKRFILSKENLSINDEELANNCADFINVVTKYAETDKNSPAYVQLVDMFNDILNRGKKHVLKRGLNEYPSSTRKIAKINN